MRLFIKQQVFSWKDRFYVRDELGNDRYYVEGELFSWGKKLHVYDIHGNEVVYIQQKLLSWMPRFYVFIGGNQVAEIVREFTFLRPKYRIDGLNWDVDGDFWAHEYTVSQAGMPIVSMSKEWFTWGDSYLLDIPNPQNELPALAIILAIDCVVAQSSGSNN